MKETLYTIPLMDAFHADDECPFCFIERNLEQNAIDFILGTAYMESDIREETDQVGFCRHHMKKMYDYGNALGNALMLKTYFKRLNKEMDSVLSHYIPTKPSLSEKFKKRSKSGSSDYVDPIAAWIAQKENTCYVCDYANKTYARYFDTFFYLYKKDPEFHQLIQNSKGFCMHHFGELMEHARTELSDTQKEIFYQRMFTLMRENMQRIEDDLSWFVNKFDYRYKDADWKNAKDAIPRGMQKLNGGYPADPPYQPSI